jgi:hypothetical protein
VGRDADLKTGQLANKTQASETMGSRLHLPR